MNNLQECIDLMGTVCIRSSSTYIDRSIGYILLQLGIHPIDWYGGASFNFMHIYNKKHTQPQHISSLLITSDWYIAAPR